MIEYGDVYIPVDSDDINEMLLALMSPSSTSKIIWMMENIKQLPPALQHQISRNERAFNSIVTRTAQEFEEYSSCVNEDFEQARDLLALPAPTGETID